MIETLFLLKQIYQSLFYKLDQDCSKNIGVVYYFVARELAFLEVYKT